MASVSVTINGKSYRMACDEGQEQHLRDLAADLDKTVGTLRGAHGEIGDSRLIVMAAILLADELSESRRRLARLEAEVAVLKARDAQGESRFEAGNADLARMIATAAERITDIARRLNAAPE